MSDCSKHKKEVAGISDMKLLAEMVGDLHYSTLVEFTKELRFKLYGDGQKDFAGGRTELAGALFDAMVEMVDVEYAIERAWKASKPHMKKD